VSHCALWFLWLKVLCLLVLWRKVVFWVTSKCGTSRPSVQVSLSLTFFFRLWCETEFVFRFRNYETASTFRFKKATRNLFMKRIMESVSNHYETDYVSCFAKKVKIYGKRNSYSVSQKFWIFSRNGLHNPFCKDVKQILNFVSHLANDIISIYFNVILG